jgi:hypothetical protein
MMWCRIHDILSLLSQLAHTVHTYSSSMRGVFRNATILACDVY